ncbi:MAG: AMP-binding protein [Chloroflexi bacterium]|nr:AMP-binding protein [Chloroflexota bacterium]
MAERISLQESLNKIITQRIKETPEYRKRIAKKSLEKLTRRDLEDFQLFQLRNTLHYAYDKSLFYRELFSKKGIEPSEVQSLADLAKLPLTDPKELAENPLRFVCVPLGDVTRVITFTSSGTTGPQKRIFFSEKDIEVMTDFMGAGMSVVATSDDVVQIMLPKGMVLGQSDLLAQGVKKMGATPVVTGIEPTPEEQIQAIKRHGSTVLFCETLRLNRITVEARKNHDLTKLGVKVLFLTSNYLSDSMRANLQSAWNCEVFTHYGLTEMGLGVAVECSAHNGYHFNEADLLAEIIDPETGEVLPEGEEGELVFTTLTREAMPLIRYRTHDISRLSSKPCTCGITALKRLDKVTRRLESVVRIGDGDEIYPAMFDEALYTIPDIVGYEVSVSKDGGKDKLTFQVEIARTGAAVEELVREVILKVPPVQKNVKTGKMTIPEIQLVTPGSLQKSTRAKKLIKDMRQEA